MVMRNIGSWNLSRSGHVRLADLVGHDAEQVEGIGLAWMLLENLPIEGLCLLQISALMELESLLECGTQVVHIILQLFSGRPLVGGLKSAFAAR